MKAEIEVQAKIENLDMVLGFLEEQLEAAGINEKVTYSVLEEIINSCDTDEEILEALAAQHKGVPERVGQVVEALREPLALRAKRRGHRRGARLERCLELGHHWHRNLRRDRRGAGAHVGGEVAKRVVRLVADG